MRKNIVTGFVLGLIVGAILMRMWMDRNKPSGDNNLYVLPRGKRTA